MDQAVGEMKTKKSDLNHFILSLLLCCFVISNCQKSNLLDPENTNQIAWQPTALDSLYVTALAVSPKGDVYATTCEGIFRSPDQGENWENLGIRCASGIAVNTNEYIFVTGGAGILRSLDGGLSWESVRLSGTGHTRPLAFGKTPGVVYTSVGISDENLIGGIYRSEDNGATWTKTSFPDSMGAWVIAVNANDDVFAGTGYGLFRSTDAGQSWALLDVGFELDYGPSIEAIAIDDVDGDIFVAINGGGVYRSSDNGNSWQKTGLASRSVVSLIIPSEMNELIFANNGLNDPQFPEGIFYSRDNGQNWMLSNIGLKNTTVVALAADSSGYVYAGTRSSGVFRTVDTVKH